MRYRRLSAFTLALAVAALTLGVLAGCASSGLKRGDRLFEARAYDDAAAAYEGVLHAGKAGPHLERVLFHLALLYGAPESPVHDEVRSRQLFEELVRRVGSGPYRAEAARVLDLESRRVEPCAEVELRQEEAADAVEAAATLGQEGEEERYQEALDELRRAVEKLRVEAAECREQLEKLKAIDLGGVP